MDRNLAAAHTLIRAQRELKMVRRTVILITVLVIICFPFTMIVFMGFFKHAPKYKYPISYVFVDVSGLATVIILFQFTGSLKESDENNQMATKSNYRMTDIYDSKV